MTDLVDAPIIFNHVARLYEQLREKADDQGIFEGSLVAEFKALNISQSYYSKLYAYLYELGCIELMRRGHGNLSSLVKLHHAPTLEKFRSSYLTNVKPRATLLEQRITHIEGRLPSADLESALAALAIRVDELAVKIRELELRLDNSG